MIRGQLGHDALIRGYEIPRENERERRQQIGESRRNERKQHHTNPEVSNIK